MDVSQGGIGLVVRELYEAGKALEIEINRPGGRQRLVCQAEVKWTAPVSDGRYRIGCCWEHRLSFGELQSVI